MLFVLGRNSGGRARAARLRVSLHRLSAADVLIAPVMLQALQCPATVGPGNVWVQHWVILLSQSYTAAISWHCHLVLRFVSCLDGIR